MKKLFKTSLLVMVFILGTATTIKSQNVFTKGSSTISLGLGLPSTMNHIALPPLFASYDHGIADFAQAGSLGFGGSLGVYGFGNREYDYKTLYLFFGPALTYHFNGIPNLKELELTSTLMLGAKLFMSNNKSDSEAGLAFSWDFKIGANYWFTNKIGATACLGYGVSVLDLGVVFNL